jgi:hypothetical protein
METLNEEFEVSISVPCNATTHDFKVLESIFPEEFTSKNAGATATLHPDCRYLKELPNAKFNSLWEI